MRLVIDVSTNVKVRQTAAGARSRARPPDAAARRLMPTYGSVHLDSSKMMRGDLEMSDVRLTDAEAHDDSDGASPGIRNLSSLVSPPYPTPRVLTPPHPSSPPSLTRPPPGGALRASLRPRADGLPPLVREWLGLSRAEGSRAARCLGGCAVLNLVLLALLVIVAVAVTSPTIAPTPAAGTSTSSDAPEHVSTSLGAVAADEPRCSEIGASALRDGGHAVDAAVAAALCLGVLHPHSSGIGGGAFAVIRLADGTSEAIEFREEAPAASAPDMFVGRPEASLEGGLAVAVPSEIHGLRLAWERHGKLPWSRLVLPAATLAEGFPVGPELARAIAQNAAALARHATSAATFLRSDRRSPLRVGDTCANPALARTLRAIAEEGADALRVGTLAEALARDVREAGGVMTADDLARYRPRVSAPVVARAFGFDILGMPPTSSGGAAVAQVMEFMAGFDRPLVRSGGLGAHRTVEAFKHAFAMRMNLGDPEADWPGKNVSGALADMLSPEFNARLRAMTRDDATLDISAYGARWNQLDDSGTTHVSVVDAERNAVALTSTVNTAFGSKVTSPSTGVVLNNEMDDFSTPGAPNGYGLAPSVANFPAPGKRPLSSMSPTIVVDPVAGAVVAAAGASGGPRIITATAQVLLDVLARGASPLEAVEAPRVHHQLTPNKVFAEAQRILGTGEWRNVSDATAEALRRRGHEVTFSDVATATTQLVTVDLETGRVHAVSDARKGGRPAAQDSNEARR